MKEEIYFVTVCFAESFLQTWWMSGMWIIREYVLERFKQIVNKKKIKGMVKEIIQSRNSFWK